MNKENLQKILENHKSWLGDCGGECADLSGVNLSGAKLSGANLRYANLNGARLNGVDLSYANLNGARLNGVDLSYANLNGAKLSYANLGNADLSGVNLNGAKLSYANLRYANLNGARLNGVDLSYANLNGAMLNGADLNYADLSYANLRDAKLNGIMYNESTAFFALQCPEEGSFIAWKKCRDDVLVKLLIPEDAKRSSATTRKCRASKAVVLEVIGAEKAISTNDESFVYEVGKEVVPDSYDDNRWKECSHGIHFFITRKEAENY